MVRRLVVSIALLLALPASAGAATLTLSGSTLSYTGAPGGVSNVTFVEPGTPRRVEVTRAATDTDPITATGCSVAGSTYTCDNVATLVINAGDMSDRITAGYLDAGDQFVGIKTIPIRTLAGGDGNDVISGGAQADAIDGGPGDDDLDGGPGDDTLAGGDGNDTLRPNYGKDTVVGGDGFDVAVYGKRQSPVFSLDGLANDGEPGENDQIGADVEGIEAAAAEDSQTVTITGDGRANRLRGTNGKAAINGGEGSDFIEGGGQDDTLTSRDGSPDFVVCNGGIDTVFADTLDTVSPSCEVVQTVASPGGPFDDRPPSVAWTAPATSATLSANRETTLSVNASDDRGITRLQFLDDDRVVCEDTEPPYTCNYQPRGGDVGRNTLIAVAVDGANQTTSVPRPVTVRRFSTRDVGISLRPSRDRRAPYRFHVRGRVLRPDVVSPSHGCSGRVTVTAKRGKKVVSSKRVRLSRVCEYSATLKFRTRTARSLKIRARFEGNDVLAAKSSRNRTARLG
jgi:Ca2+-binding RTX toxin-like protein